MIMTLRTLDYEGLKGSLPKDAHILIWSCNTCARMCGGLGGKASSNALASMLEEDGWKVLGSEVLTASCFRSAVRKRLDRPDVQASMGKVTHVIPLTCQTGVSLLMEEMPQLILLDVVRTVGLGYLSESRGPVLTDPLFREIAVPEGGIPLNEVAETLGLHSGPFER